MTKAETRALFVRHRAAIELVHARELRGWEALALVVFPPPELERIDDRRPGGHQVVSEERRARAVELVEAGLSHGKAAREVGVARTTVSDWVRSARAISTRAA